MGVFCVLIIVFLVDMTVVASVTIVLYFVRMPVVLFRLVVAWEMLSPSTFKTPKANSSLIVAGFSLAQGIPVHSFPTISS